MIEEVFKEISENLNCKYLQENTKYSTLSGRSYPVTDHYLEIEYKNSIINASFELGSQDTSEIHTFIETQQPNKRVEITTHGHFKRLFIKNNSPWKIKTSDPIQKKELIKLLESSELNIITKETSFEPIILGIQKGNKYEITTRFSLAFENKEKAILPVINLYKNLIDLFRK